MFIMIETVENVVQEPSVFMSNERAEEALRKCIKDNQPMFEEPMTDKQIEEAVQSWEWSYDDSSYEIKIFEVSVTN